MGDGGFSDFLASVVERKKNKLAKNRSSVKDLAIYVPKYRQILLYGYHGEKLWKMNETALEVEKCTEK